MQFSAQLLEQHERVLPPEKPLVQRRGQRNGPFFAEGKLRGDHQRHASLVQRVSKARSGDYDRADIAAVATRYRDDRRPMDLLADRGQRTGKLATRYYIGRAAVATKHQPIGFSRGLAKIAMRQDMDVRVAIVTAFPKHIRQRRIDQDRQQIPELFTSAVLR